MRADKTDIKSIVKMPDILTVFGIRSDRLRIHCPLREHKRSDPPFAVKSDSWYCFACGERGDIFRFVQLMNDCDFKTALDWICQEFNIPNDGLPDPLFAQRLQDRRREAQERKDREMYQDYVYGRLCDYLRWLESQPQSYTKLITNHIAWGERIIKRMQAGEIIFDGSDILHNIEDRVRGMWKQHNRVN